MKQETIAQQTQRQIQAPNAAGQKKKKSLEDYKRQSDQNKKRWMPLVRYMKKHAIKFKTARCGKFRIEYFRTEELEELIQNHKDQLQKDSTLKDLIRSWNSEVVYFVRPEGFPKLKYPKQLDKSEGNAASKFASFKFDTSEPKTWLFPAILLGIIAVVLFPLWPYALKYTVFMICLVLVVAILSLIVLRLVVYLVFAIFGMSFWILPNFFADCTIAQSFLPVYSVTKWQSGAFSIVGQLLAFSILAYYGYHAYIDPSWIYENIDITKASMDDLHDWGVSKIKGEMNFSQSALTDRSVDSIMNQTAEANFEDHQKQNDNLLEQQNEHDQEVYNQEVHQSIEQKHNNNEDQKLEQQEQGEQHNDSQQL